MGWDEIIRWTGNEAPESVLPAYRDKIRKLAYIRRRIKNPVMKNGGTLKPATIRGLECDERYQSKTAKAHRELIKRMVKYNLLPTSKLISGKQKTRFVFSLNAMVMFPFLSKVVYFANETAEAIYKRWHAVDHEDVEELRLYLVSALEQATRRVKSKQFMMEISYRPPQKPKGNVHYLNAPRSNRDVLVDFVKEIRSERRDEILDE